MYSKFDQYLHKLIVSQCQQEFRKTYSRGRTLIQYVRDNKGRRLGVLVAFLDGMGEPHVGYSRCHRGHDRWNKYVGLEAAIFNARPLVYLLNNFTGQYNGPHSLREKVQRFVQRAGRYYQLLVKKGENK